MSNLYHANQYISTVLATAGGIDDSQTTDIDLQSITGIETTKPGIACLSYSSPIDTTNAEWVTYTTINSTTKKLEGVTRGAEGFSAKSHGYGVTVAFPVSKSHINNLATALSIGGDSTDGVTSTIDDDSMATASATTLATSESIKAYVDSGSLLSKIITSTRDLAAADGNVAYTGVGFKPTSIVVLASINNTNRFSVGMADSAKGIATLTQYLDSETLVKANLLSIAVNSTNYVDVGVVSYDTDGITLSFTKTGTPTGTGTFYILCLR